MANSVEVRHGAGVEAHEDWFCEAVWNGRFAEGGFDETDIVAGSGGRRRGDRILFVSSGSTVDRLQYFATASESWVSNSLVCLLSQLQAELDPTYRGYYDDFYSIVKGIDRVHRQLQTSRGPVLLNYFRNLQWSGESLVEIPKSDSHVDFATFEKYVGFLRECLARLAQNAGDAERHRPFELLSTLSSGYDSSTVSTLAQEVGCRQALTFDVDFRGESDSGEAVARALGMETIPVSDRAWRNMTMPEVPFLAGNAMGEEVRFKGAEEHLFGKVLLTGYHGDKVWSKETKSLGPGIVRGDPSGLGLTEYRLWAGFIHCPVAFWGVRQIVELHAISNSRSMKNWDVGGDYNRPICRRICEEAGIPRDAFGMHKRNASVILHNYDELMTPSSREDYFQWLRDRRDAWTSSGRIPPIPNAALERISYLAARRGADILRRTPYFWRWAHRCSDGPVYLRRYVFPWAVDRAKRSYG